MLFRSAFRSKREARARESRLEAQIRDAAEAGEVVAVAAVGSNPTRVKWAGAQELETFEYGDLRRYKRDTESRRVPHLRARCCRPARVGDRRKVRA